MGAQDLHGFELGALGLRDGSVVAVGSGGLPPHRDDSEGKPTSHASPRGSGADAQSARNRPPPEPPTHTGLAQLSFATRQAVSNADRILDWLYIGGSLAAAR